MAGDERAPATPGRVELRLLGQTLSLRSGAPPEYLRSLVAHIEERVAALQRAGIRDPMMALSLAALEITDDLFRARDDQTRGERDVKSRLDRLLELLDDASGPSPSREAHPDSA